MDRPLVVFESFDREERFTKVLNLRATTDVPTEMDANHVMEYVTTTSPVPTHIFTSVVRTPTNTARSIMEMASRLFRRFRGNILFFSTSVGVLECFNEYRNHRQNIVLNPEPRVVAAVFGVMLTDAQRSTLQALSDGSYRRPAMALTTTMWPPQDGPFFDVGLLVGEELDEELQFVLRETAREAEEATRNAPAVPLKREWEDVLKPSAPDAVAGQPLCNVCLTSVATIVFVDCQHQCICDACCRIYFTSPTLQKTCPVCRTPATQIVRPIVPRTVPEASAVVVAAPKKRRRQCK